MGLTDRPTSDEDLVADSLRGSHRRNRVLTILALVAVLAVVVILHLTGVLGENLHRA